MTKLKKLRVECPERSRGAEYIMYYVYMIKNSENKIYIGVTKNLSQRLNYHNTKQGANFTKKSDATFEIAFQEKYNTLEQARKREIQIKKWRRDKKEAIVYRYTLKLPTIR